MSKIDEKVEELRAELGEIEMDVLTSYTLADAIREGSTVTTQAYNWGDGETACALTATVVAAKARGYV
jgi:hypothetical protein